MPSVGNKIEKQTIVKGQKNEILISLECHQVNRNVRFNKRIYGYEKSTIKLLK